VSTLLTILFLPGTVGTVNEELVMTPKDILKQYDDSVTKASQALGFTRAAIYKWLANRRIPYASQEVIELRSGGLLKATKRKSK
jgi:hypothetical protein